jgi:competence protein ComEC
VLYLVPLFERLFVRVPKKILWFFPLRETLAVTCGAQTAVLPFLIYKTGVVSLVSVPVNILIVPMMPVVMGTTTLSLLFGMLHPLLAMPCTYVTHILLMLVIKLIHFFAGLPYAAVLLQHIPLWICRVPMWA